ncbi:Diguanylate cyclase DgcZ [Gammaproteobacteria bacterium]|nr:Diguanylate cyclase DgcZ [Gammaproteobacteria bacterium]
MAWTHRVLRCAVLGVSPGEDVLAPWAHTLCHFGHWFAQNKAHFGQLNAQNARRLEAVHQAMHDAMRSICSDVLAGRPGQSANLEAFERTQSKLIKLTGAFKTQLLANAVWRDHLTGLPLRYGIENEFNLLQRISKRGRFLLYLMMIDVDFFKQVNDGHGHLVGDIALRHLAGVLKRTKRDNEPLYRFGGEEFLLLMQSKSSNGIAQTAQRFIDAVRNSPVPVSQDTSIQLTITVGLSRVGEGEGLNSAMERADKALYEGKKAGRDRYVIADD